MSNKQHAKKSPAGKVPYTLKVLNHQDFCVLYHAKQNKGNPDESR